MARNKQVVQIPETLSKSLFDEALRAQYARISASLPPFFSSIQVYELHLTESRRRIDLSTLVRNTPEDRMAFAQWVAGMRKTYPPEAFDALYRLAQAWVHAPGPFANIHFLWLEFDLRADSTHLPVPGLVAGFVPGTEPEMIQRDILHLATFLPLQAEAIYTSLSQVFTQWEACTGSCTFSYMLGRRPGNAFRLLFAAEELHFTDKLTGALPDADNKFKFGSISRQLAAMPGYLRLELNLDETGILPMRAVHHFAHLHPGNAPGPADLLHYEGVCTDENIGIVRKLAVGQGPTSPHLLATKLLYHGENRPLTGKAYFRYIAYPG
ncbi:MAG: hypothetical protein WBB45_12515 [Cyclobacteriaceae bacterium]